MQAPLSFLAIAGEIPGMNQTHLLNLPVEPVIFSTEIIQEESPLLRNVIDMCQLVKMILKILKLRTLMQKTQAAYQLEPFSEESGSLSVGHQVVLRSQPHHC